MIKLATDLDGTIYKGNKLIEGVKDSYENLIDNDVEIYFITNNSSQTPYEIKEKLETLLQSEIDINKIITPLNVLKKMFLNQTTNIYVYGSSNLKKFVESIKFCNENVTDFYAVIGPSIRSCCFEIMDDVLNSFDYKFITSTKKDKFRVDLQAWTVYQLIKLGFSKEKINIINKCTFCLDDRYYSYRRDGSNSGRMYALAGWVK